jgi:hypothetical protein
MSEWKLPDDVVEPSIEGTGGGNFLWESGVYDTNIKLAYLTQTSGGAYFLNVELEKAGEKFGRIRDKWCVKSGNEKGNKTYYISKDGKKQPLPGYQTAKSLCLAVTGEDFDTNMTKVEKKVIKVWDFKEGKEMPSEYPVITNLINQKVKVAVRQVIEDKRTQNSKGVWVASGDTKPVNQCQFFGNIDTGKTAEELKNNKDAAVMDKWATKNTGIVVDKSTKSSKAQDSAADIMGDTSPPAQGSLFDTKTPAA